MFGTKITIGVMVAAGAVIAALGVQSTLRGMKIDKLEAAAIEKDITIEGLNSKIATMDLMKIDAETIAALSAETCRKTINFRVRHVTESKEIQDAPDADAAIAAYDRLLCERPEAAGHPKCAGTTEVPE